MMVNLSVLILWWVVTIVMHLLLFGIIKKDWRMAGHLVWYGSTVPVLCIGRAYGWW